MLVLSLKPMVCIYKKLSPQNPRCLNSLVSLHFLKSIMYIFRLCRTKQDKLFEYIQQKAILFLDNWSNWDPQIRLWLLVVICPKSGADLFNRPLAAMYYATWCLESRPDISRFPNAYLMCSIFFTYSFRNVHDVWNHLMNAQLRPSNKNDLAK